MFVNVEDSNQRSEKLMCY